MTSTSKTYSINTYLREIKAYASTGGSSITDKTVKDVEKALKKTGKDRFTEAEVMDTLIKSGYGFQLEDKLEEVNTDYTSMSNNDLFFAVDSVDTNESFYVSNAKKSDDGSWDILAVKSTDDVEEAFSMSKDISLNLDLDSIERDGDEVLVASSESVPVSGSGEEEGAGEISASEGVPNFIDSYDIKEAESVSLGEFSEALMGKFDEEKKNIFVIGENHDYGIDNSYIETLVKELKEKGGSPIIALELPGITDDANKDELAKLDSQAILALYEKDSKRQDILDKVFGDSDSFIESVQDATVNEKLKQAFLDGEISEDDLLNTLVVLDAGEKIAFAGSYSRESGADGRENIIDTLEFSRGNDIQLEFFESMYRDDSFVRDNYSSQFIQGLTEDGTPIVITGYFHANKSPETEAQGITETNIDPNITLAGNLDETKGNNLISTFIYDPASDVFDIDRESTYKRDSEIYKAFFEATVETASEGSSSQKKNISRRDLENAINKALAAKDFADITKEEIDVLYNDLYSDDFGRYNSYQSYEDFVINNQDNQGRQNPDEGFDFIFKTE